MADPPGFLGGLKGSVMELVYFLRVTKQCPACGASWNGYYPKEYMDYCHHCGEQLIEP